MQYLTKATSKSSNLEAAIKSRLLKWSQTEKQKKSHPAMKVLELALQVIRVLNLRVLEVIVMIAKHRLMLLLFEVKKLLATKQLRRRQR